MGRNKIDRVGEENYNNFGTPMKIVEYKDANSTIVEFQDEYKTQVHTTYKHFKNGKVKNPYDRNIYGLGYVGKGKYKIIGENRKMTKAYIIWKNLMQRCYDPYFLNEHPTYRDCVICEEWLCYQNFAKWYYKNYYDCNNEEMHLDKDILCKGNKIYYPNACILVPQRINVLFVKHDNARGEYPIGVSYHKASGKLVVQCNVYENEKRKQKYLGHFPLNRPFQAFYAYKVFKENYIKQIADEYKDLIPKKLYDAMMYYQVEIND